MGSSIFTVVTVDTVDTVVTVDPAKCVRCAACAIVAPGVFEVSRKGTHIVQQPVTAAERSAAMAASLMCPTQAIGRAP